MDILSIQSMKVSSGKYDAPTTAPEPDPFTSGICILFDVIGSTRLKKEFPESWRRRFEDFYKLVDRLAEILSAAPIAWMANPVVKHLGDGVLLFFPIAKTSKKTKGFLQREVAEFVFGELLQFWAYLDAEFDSRRIRVKTVVTALNDIHYFGDKHSSGTSVNDALGRGIDFTFRLEKFGDSGHLVLNDLMYKSISVVQDEKSGYLTIKCKRHVKGWDESQEFWIVSRREWLQSAYPEKDSDELLENVYLELFKLYIESRDSPAPAQLLTEIESDAK